MAALKASMLKPIMSPPASMNVNASKGVLQSACGPVRGETVGQLGSLSRGVPAFETWRVRASSSSRVADCRDSRPTQPRSYLPLGDPSLVLARPDSVPVVPPYHHVQLLHQSWSPNFCVAIIRPPIEPSPDVKPSINPFSPNVPDPNLPTPPPATPVTEPEPEANPSTPIELPEGDPVPEFSPSTIPSPADPPTPVELPPITPSESPIPSVPIEIPTVVPEQIPSTPTPTELPAPGEMPESTPIIGFLAGVDASEVPRGPPIMPPNTAPILPPDTPGPIPTPSLPFRPPPGSAEPIPMPQTPPIPPGMPGPVPPPVPPPETSPPFAGPEIPSVPPPAPEIGLPPLSELPTA